MTNEWTEREKQRIFSDLGYENFYGVRREVTYIGKVVPVEHGLGFTPQVSDLTVRIHYMKDNVVNVYCPNDPDDTYVYVAFERQGTAWIEISHPPRYTREV